MSDFRDPDTDWKNNGTECPVFGVFAITGETVIGGKIVLSGAQPSTTFTRLYGVNDIFKVSANGYAGAYTHGIVRVLYDTGTPAVGETWGPKSGQWQCSKGFPGFTVLGIVDATAKIMLAKVEPYDTLIGKCTSNVSKGSSGTFNIWLKASGSWAAVSGWSVSAECLGAAYTANKYASMEYIGGIWVAGAMEC